MKAIGMILLNDMYGTWINPNLVITACKTSFPGHYQSSSDVASAIEINGSLTIRYNAPDYDALDKLIESEIERISEAARK